MRSFAKALFLATSVVMVASPALAEGPTSPKVRGLVRDEGPAGSVVVCDAVNFSDKFEDYDIEIDGKKCLIVQASTDRVTFVVPGMGINAGTYTITIKVKGETCTCKYKILKFKTKEEELAWRDIWRQKYEGVGKYEDPFKQVQKFLNIDKFEITTGENPCAIVSGTTQIPEGLSIGIVFGFADDGERQIDARKLQIHGAAGPDGSRPWKAVFGPWNGKQMYAGRYFAMLTFEMARQSPLDLKRVGWPDKLDEGQRTVFSNVWKRQYTEVGTKEDAAKQELEVKNHYTDLCRKTTDALETLERAYASAGKSYFRKATGSGIDEDEWVKWVQSRGVGQTEDDLKKIKADARFIRGDHFNADAWLAWVKDDHWKSLLEVMKRHQTLKERFVGTKDEHLPVEGDCLISIIVKLTQLYSTEIYTKNKLDLPEILKTAQGFAGGFEATSVSRQAFENQRAVLLQRVKATLPPAGAPAAAPAAPKADAPKPADPASAPPPKADGPKKVQ